LVAGTPDVTVSGTINAYGTLGQYVTDINTVSNTFEAAAALFGPVSGQFTVTNSGLIESQGTGGANFDAGVLLGAAGTVFNSGTILGSNGIAVFQNSGSSYIENATTIIGSLGTGVIVYGATGTSSTVMNAGSIGGQVGIELAVNDTSGTPVSAGYVGNTGTVTGYNSAGLTENSNDGFIATGVGVYLAASGTLVNSGSIAGNHVGVVVENDPGYVTNTGIISSSRGYGVYLNNGGTINNTCSIVGYDQGIFLGETAVGAMQSISNDGLIEATATAERTTLNGTPASYPTQAIFDVGAAEILNQTDGVITAQYGVGIELISEDFALQTPAPGAIINLGTITGRYGVSFYGIGSLNNIGVIIAADRGFEAKNAAASGYNQGLIEATAGTFSNIYGTQTVSETGAAVLIDDGGSFTNAVTGTLEAPAGFGVRLLHGGSVDNAGVINAGVLGVYDINGQATLYNSGTILATGTLPLTSSYQTTIGVNEAGVYLAEGGTVTNTGIITGTHVGIAIEAALSTVANSGIVTGNYGIYLQAGGSVSNSGTVIAGIQGIASGGDLTTYNGAIDITNSGEIEATGEPYAADGSVEFLTAGTAGILDFGGTVVNAAGGTILTPNGTGIALYGEVDTNGTFSAAAAVLTNAGSVNADTGVDFEGIGSVDNTGVIFGTVTGVSLLASTAGVPDYIPANAPARTLINAGVIDASMGTVVNERGTMVAGVGVMLPAGNIYNLAGGTIAGDIAIDSNDTIASYENRSAVTLTTPLYLNNAGVITGAAAGVSAQGAPATIVNTGTITGDTLGVALRGGGTVTTAGSIGGSVDAVTFAAGYNNELIIDAGAVFSGTVDGGNTLGATATSMLQLGAGAGYLNGVGSAFVNFQTIDFAPGALWAVSGDEAGLAAGQSIEGFTFGDTIALTDFTAASDSFVDGTGLVLGTVNGTAATLDLIGTFSTGYFNVYTVGSATDIVFDYSPTASVTAGSSETLGSGDTIGAASLTAGTLSVTGSQNSVGTLSVGAGSSDISLSPNADLTIGSALSIVTGATLDVVGGTLVIEGSISLTGALTETGASIFDNGVFINDSTLTLDPSSGTFASLSGTGVDDVGTGSTLDVTGNIDAGQTIVFTGSLAALEITDTASILGTIDVQGIQNTIDVTDLSPGDVTGSSFDNVSDVLEITYGSGSTLGLTFAHDLSSFALVSDGVSGLDIDIPCYAAGTRVLGVAGEIAVEDVQVGDRLVTVREGGPAERTVVWTGRRRLDVSRHANPAMVQPVRIRAGAFGGGIPERDLRLSPHHAVYIDGDLFEAIALVNGITIIQESDTRFVTYHHIELDEHDIMLAEGLAVESFLPTGNRAMFERAGPMQLHPEWRTPEAASPCVTLHRVGPKVEQAFCRLRLLAERFVALPLAERRRG
jgi:hypothetical protein